MTIQELTWKTITVVRRDIAELKRCQVQYFSLSVTATGAILGLAATVTAPEIRGLGMLAPLGLLLPCWMIFFDKATTITRNVGYQRALERLLQADPVQFHWLLELETSLGKFRAAQDAGKLAVGVGVNPPGIGRVLLLGTRHRYWILNWYTFCALSLLSCILGYNFLGDGIFDFRLPLGIHAEVPERTLWGGPAFVAVFLVGMYTFRMVTLLVRGRDSYEANARAWARLVEVESQRATGV